MTRARDYALALLVGVFCLGPATAFAQYGPAPNASSGGAPGGYSVSPFGAPEPAGPDPWYGNADEVEESINRVGPRIKIAKSFLRAEYLNWTIGRPGNVVLGAPVAAQFPALPGGFIPGVTDQTQPFVIYAPLTNTPIGFGSVPTTDSMNLSSANGLQLTAGVELIEGGQFEVSGFMLARKTSGYTLPLGTQFDLGTLTGLPASVAFTSPTLVPSVIATSTLSNGQISDHLFLYNQSFSASFTSQLWGGEANYLWGDTVDTFQFLPLAGARYMNLTETLTQIGVFQDQFAAVPPVSTQIGAHTINNLWGGQIGFRAQAVTKYLDFGVTPKLMLLGNTAYSSVYAARFRSNSDPTVFNDDLSTKFTFGTDVNAFAAVHLRENFTVRIGYSLIWINQVTRPQKDIVYNDNGPAAPAGIGQQTVFHDILINGFNIGCELRY